MSNEKLACILVSRGRKDLVKQVMSQISNMREMDVYLVLTGGDFFEVPNATTVYYSDPDFKGKAFGHNVGLDFAMRQKKYQYFWIHMNDAMYDDPESCNTMVELMDRYGEYGILSPTCSNQHHYPGATPSRYNKIKTVTTCDYLSFWMRGDMIYRPDRLFLNPDFKYSWGAIFELSYRMYAERLKIGYVGHVSYEHLGGSTYGQVKNAPSREDYIKRAKKFARDYMKEVYGGDWDKVMWDKAKRVAPEIMRNSYEWGRQAWKE